MNEFTKPNVKLQYFNQNSLNINVKNAVKSWQTFKRREIGHTTFAITQKYWVGFRSRIKKDVVKKIIEFNVVQPT